MNSWWLAAKDSLLLGRDRKALLTLVLMPLLLIGILGAAFGTIFSNDGAEIEKFSLGIVNNDEGELGRALAEDVFAKGLPGMLDAKAMDEEELYRKLKDQKLEVGLVIGKGFSESIMSGSETAVKLVAIPSASIPSMVTENVIQQFASEAAIRSAGARIAVEAAVKSGGTADAAAFVAPLEISGESEELVKEKAAGKEEKTVSSFQYYSAGMAVMFLLMTVVNGVSAMIEEKEQEVYKRLLVSKLTHAEYVAGKFLGLLFLSLIQMSMIILGTTFIFGVDWGVSVAGVILVAGCFVFSACGLGVMTGSLLKTGKAFETAGMLGTQLMAAVGGSMVPLYVFPDWANSIVKILPNALALQSFLAVMGGEGVSAVGAEAAMLFFLGLVFLAVGWLRLSTERRRKYA